MADKKVEPADLPVGKELDRRVSELQNEGPAEQAQAQRLIENRRNW